MKELNIKPEAQILIDEWKTAKENEKGWADHRKAQEERLMEAYGDEFAEIMNNLEETTTLTTSIGVGGLKVTLGSSMAVTQVGAIEFLQQYPTMQSILFKQEFKAVSKPVLSTLTGPETEMSKFLDEIVEFKPRKPSFSLK